jgi:hypothetical protein
MISSWPFALLAFVLCGVCHAHQDRIVEVNADGTLIGIPEEFGPGKLTVAFSRQATGPKILSVDVTLRGRTTHMPLCATGVIGSTRPEHIVASASWYHDEQFVPYYLSIKFVDPDFDKTSLFRPGFSMLFNLRTARLIEMTAWVDRDRGKALQRLPLDLESMCPKDFEKFKDARK